MAKYAEQVIISATENSVLFQVVNDLNSVFAEVEFKKDFFAEYSTDGFPFDCKVDVRSLILVFRVINLGLFCLNY